MAELLKVYYPRYVDLHNYVPANNFTTKKENWNILNRKVLSKIDMKLSKDTINQLANYHPGVIEHLLLELRTRLLRDPEHQDSLRRISEKEPIVESKNDADAEKERSIFCSNDPDQSTPEGSLLKRIKTRLIFIFHWLCLWLRIWQHLPVIWHRGSRKLCAFSRARYRVEPNLETARFSFPARRRRRLVQEAGHVAEHQFGGRRLPSSVHGTAAEAPREGRPYLQLELQGRVPRERDEGAGPEDIEPGLADFAKRRRLGATGEEPDERRDGQASSSLGDRSRESEGGGIMCITDGANKRRINYHCVRSLSARVKRSKVHRNSKASRDV
nr:uncharacterized protein LOC117221952 isoform X2 [Megalopta genalis]